MCAPPINYLWSRHCLTTKFQQKIKNKTYKITDKNCLYIIKTIFLAEYIGDSNKLSIKTHFSLNYHSYLEKYKCSLLNVRMYAKWELIIAIRKLQLQSAEFEPTLTCTVDMVASVKRRQNFKDCQGIFRGFSDIFSGDFLKITYLYWEWFNPNTAIARHLNATF